MDKKTTTILGLASLGVAAYLISKSGKKNTAINTTDQKNTAINTTDQKNTAINTTDQYICDDGLKLVYDAGKDGRGAELHIVCQNSKGEKVKDAKLNPNYKSEYQLELERREAYKNDPNRKDTNYVNPNNVVEPCPKGQLLEIINCKQYPCPEPRCIPNTDKKVFVDDTPIGQTPPIFPFRKNQPEYGTYSQISEELRNQFYNIM